MGLDPFPFWIQVKSGPYIYIYIYTYGFHDVSVNREGLELGDKIPFSLYVFLRNIFNFGALLVTELLWAHITLFVNIYYKKQWTIG